MGPCSGLAWKIGKFIPTTAHVGGFALTPPPTISNQAETLIFEFSMSKIGADQLFNNNPTNNMEKIRKRRSVEFASVWP